MEFILLILALAIIIAALSFFSYFRRKKNLQSPAAEQSKKPALVNCPLCGSGLQKGENMISKVFRPMNVPDQRCIISGCPHCFPVCESGVKRQCPVCGARVGAQGYLVSRLFNKTGGKKHVMIVGCNSCLKNEGVE